MTTVGETGPIPRSASGISRPARRCASWRGTRESSGAWRSRPTADTCSQAGVTWRQSSGTRKPGPRSAAFVGIRTGSGASPSSLTAGAAVSSSERTIRLWDVETGREIDCLRGHTNGITWVAVSPDGRRLLSSSYDGRELRLWDVASRKMMHRIGWGNGHPLRGSFTPDGRHAVWGGTDGVIRMYRLPAPDQAKTDQPASPAPPAAAKP